MESFRYDPRGVRKLMKGEISAMLALIIGLITIIIVGAIIFTLFGGVGQEIDRSTQVTSIQSWLMLKAQAEEQTKGIAKTSNRPPIAELSEPIIIDDETQLISQSGEAPEAAQEIGSAMVDCWNAFHRGEISFSNVPDGDSDTFCFSCTGIEVSEEIKQKGYSLTDFKNYLNTTPISFTDPRTHMEYLSNINEDYHYLVPDYIKLNEDVFVYFVALTGTETTLGIEIPIEGWCLEETDEDDNWCANIEPERNGWCSANAAGKNPLQGIPLKRPLKITLNDETYVPMILVGNAKTISHICDPKKYNVYLNKQRYCIDYIDELTKDCKEGALSGKPLTMMCT